MKRIEVSRTYRVEEKVLIVKKAFAMSRFCVQVARKCTSFKGKTTDMTEDSML